MGFETPIQDAIQSDTMISHSSGEMNQWTAGIMRNLVDIQQDVRFSVASPDEGGLKLAFMQSANHLRISEAGMVASADQKLEAAPVAKPEEMKPVAPDMGM